jgi:Pentatricopeptide repeat domain
MHIHTNTIITLFANAHKGLYCICWLLLIAFYTQLLGRMEQTHRNNLNVCAYSTAVSVVGTNGKQWQQAFAIFNRIKQKGLIVDVVAYRSCIMMLQANDQWQSAVEVLQAMILDKTQPDVNSLNAVIDVCLKNQQWRVGLRLYEMVRMMLIALTWSV